MKILSFIPVLVLIAAALLVSENQQVNAATDCTFTVSGSTMSLDADCTTDESILIGDGMTLDGNGHTITAVDPVAGHFTGAVVTNAGTSAHVTKLVVTVSGLANVCDAGDNRLRGIMLEGASGSITHTTVDGINQGPSGCQEGNAIEVRNAPFDNTHPNTLAVEISHNTVTNYQKTGIAVIGDLDVLVAHNSVGESATQDNLAANSIQVSNGATGVVRQNHVDGNQWKGTSDYVATAILILYTEGLLVENNIVRGNSDVGIYEFGDSSSLINNKVFDVGADHPNSGYDYGLGAWGTNVTAEKNKVSGFEIPLDGTIGEKNVVPNGHG